MWLFAEKRRTNTDISVGWLQLASVSAQRARTVWTQQTSSLFFMLFTEPPCILLDCWWSIGCISLDKIALTWMYLLSDASTAFTTLTDGCSPVAWRNIVKSELLLTVTQWVGFSSYYKYHEERSMYFQNTGRYEHERTLNSWDFRQKSECSLWALSSG